MTDSVADEIRVIAPSCSKRPKGRKLSYARAQKRLEALGYTVSFGGSIAKVFHLDTARAEDRAADFNAAIADANVKAVLAMHGGWAANDILPLIDWQLVKDNPKPLIGYSDITVLLNAVYAKTGCPAFLGPNFDTLGRRQLWQYGLENLDRMLRQDLPYSPRKSRFWMTRGDKRLHRAKPWQVLQAGQAEGVLVGGNLGTFYLLQGTPYQPRFDQPFILLAEDDDEAGKFTAREFARRLESILQLPGVRQNLRGVIIGRFQPSAKVRDKDLVAIIAAKHLGNIPVIARVDFGHTYPMLTLPIGGTAKLLANANNVEIALG